MKRKFEELLEVHILSCLVVEAALTVIYKMFTKKQKTDSEIKVYLWIKVSIYQ